MTWLDKIDTGAQYNVIPVEGLENISPKSYLQPVNIKLSRFNGSKIPLVGKCLLTLDHKNNSFKVLFIVVDSKFFSEFHDSFGEIGTLNTTHHIEVIDNVKPVVNPVRKVPHALKPKLEKELKQVIDLDIIEQIKKPLIG